MRAYHLAHPADNQGREAHALFLASAIFIGTQIRGRREKFVYQVTVSPMDLHRVVACALRAPRRAGISLRQCHDLLPRQFARERRGS